MADRIVISSGAEYERRKADGTLEPLTIDDITRGVFIDRSGRIFAPCQTWEKDFAGQVTAGRIGRPVIRYCPLDWHPEEIANAVQERLVHD